MTQQPTLPDPEKVQQTVTQMREVCYQFDALNLALNELIAQVEADSVKTCIKSTKGKRWN